MSISDCLSKMKSIQRSILDFFENQENTEENFQNLNTQIENLKIHDNSYQIRMFLHILIKIANNHNRQQNFWGKMERLLQLFKKDMLEKFTNNELFNIFNSNKRLLLYLIEEKIITFNIYIARKIIKKLSKYNYHLYFAPEIKPIIKNMDIENNYNIQTRIEEINSTEISENFYQNRKNGENEDHICELIRTDSIKEFIIYVEKNSIKLNSNIEPSIFETNQFFVKNFSYQNNSITINLIEYAAFFGSIQIFKYLQLNHVFLTSSIWPCAIHGNNSEMIHILEENKILPTNNDYLQIFIESIKCYHNDLSNYCIYNYLQNDEGKIKSSLNYYFKYYNFAFIENEMINESSIYYLCKYDYYEFLNVLLKNVKINLNKRIKGSSLLYTACKKDNLDIVKILLNQDEIDVNKGYHIHKYEKNDYDNIQNLEKTKSPLQAAVINDNTKIVKILLENKKIDVNALNIKIDSNYPARYQEDEIKEDEKEEEEEEKEIDSKKVNKHDLLQMIDLLDDEWPYNDQYGWPDRKYFPPDVLGEDISNIKVIFQILFFQIKFFNTIFNKI